MAIENIPLTKIDDNPFQPRSSYSTNAVAELAHSIKEIGLRQVPEGRRVNGRFQLAYGHQRKRAFQKLAKLNPKEFNEMPVDVKNITDKQMIEYAIEENLRRSDITPMDVARTIELYLTNFKDETVTSAGKKFNMTQGNVSNMLRVLKCPQEVLEKINEGKINFTMARELLIFQGKKGTGYEQKWSRAESRSIQVPRNDKWLMLAAIKGVGGQYGCASTVDGIKKSIFNVCRENLKHLEKDYSYYSDDRYNPLFSIKEAGCFKCENMVRAFETKTQARHFCTDEKCWDKRQESHKKKQAIAAKKKMEEDITRRLAEDEAARVKAHPSKGISQEIPAEDIINAIPEEEREAAGKRLKNFEGYDSVPCRTCLNAGHCDGTTLVAKSGSGADTVFTCRDHMGKGDVSKVRKKATISIPAELKQLTKEKAGTRAEVLDIHELRAGNYGQLKTGYVQLKGEYGSELEHMDNPEECVNQCTQGFHYAFNSDPGTRYGDNSKKPGVLFICTNPKCVAKKKGAFTRAKNAAGQSKKKAEVAAIKKAVEQTDSLDNSRMKLIIHIIAFGHSDSYYGQRDSAIEWVCKKLCVDMKDPKNPTSNYIDPKIIKPRLYAALEKLKEDELAKLITEYYLCKIMYQGDINDYKILTSEPLQWMGINIQIEKLDGKVVPKRPVPAEEK